ERVGRLLADQEAVRLTGIRSAPARVDGDADAVGGILKLFGSEAVQAAAALALETGGADGDSPISLFDEYLESMAATLYGGTSEIQRNIIAERILGLPKGA
ncbi:MAG: acyl-CoA dehydrogenase family protein, partial [Microbacterium sp.]